MPRRVAPLALVVGLLVGLLAGVPSAASAAGEDPGTAVSLRTYRLALLSDPSYAAAVAPTALSTPVPAPSRSRAAPTPGPMAPRSRFQAPARS